MTKTVVTPEMVERGSASYREWRALPSTESLVRDILEAALSEPEEIEVTEEMEQEGAHRIGLHYGIDLSRRFNPLTRMEVAADIYRAMRKLEKAPKGLILIPDRRKAQRRSSELWACTPTCKRSHTERRKSR